MSEHQPDEVAHVLSTLQDLIHAVTSPILKACLADAHADIVHLTGPDDQSGAEDRAAA